MKTQVLMYIGFLAFSTAVMVGTIYLIAAIIDTSMSSVAAWWAVLWIAGEVTRREVGGS